MGITSALFIREYDQNFRVLGYIKIFLNVTILNTLMVQNMDKIWDYKDGTKSYRTKLKYFVISMLYFLHKHEDYPSSMSKIFKKVIAENELITQNYGDMLKANELISILKSMSRHSLLARKEEIVRGVTKTVYRLPPYVITSLVARYSYEKRQVSRRSRKKSLEIETDLINEYNLDFALRKKSKLIKEPDVLGDDLERKILFRVIQTEQFSKIISLIQKYSSKLSDETIILNTTNYKKYDLFTIFIHILDILETIEQYLVLTSLLKQYTEHSERKKTIIETIRDYNKYVFDIENECIVIIYNNETYQNLKKSGLSFNTYSLSEQYILYPVKFLKEQQRLLNNHYMLKYYNMTEREELANTFKENQLSETISFIKDIIVNYTYMDRK